MSWSRRHDPSYPGSTKMRTIGTSAGIRRRRGLLVVLPSCSRSSKSELRGRYNIAFHYQLDLLERVFVVSGGVRHNTVCRRENPQLSHVRIVGGEQHADIAGNSCKDDAADTQTLEQR